MGVRLKEGPHAQRHIAPVQGGLVLDRHQTAVDGSQNEAVRGDDLLAGGGVNQDRPYPSSPMAPIHHQHAPGDGPLSTRA